MKDFRQLNVWGKAHELTTQLYPLTHKFPKDEIYNLTSQMRRASISIPTNIAEGCGRSTDPDFVRFLSISMGSASELEYLMFLAFDLKYIDNKEYEALQKRIVEIKKMLYALMRKTGPFI